MRGPDHRAVPRLARWRHRVCHGLQAIAFVDRAILGPERRRSSRTRPHTHPHDRPGRPRHGHQPRLAPGSARRPDLLHLRRARCPQPRRADLRSAHGTGNSPRSDQPERGNDSFLPADSELTASILVPLVDADQKRSAGIRRELLGSFLPWASEAELERIALELVDAWHGLVLVGSILIPRIDRLRFATRIQSDNPAPPYTIPGP